MFDLSNIDFIKSDVQHGIKSYSFVGLKRKENSERLEFWLPLGFDDFNETFEKSKSFFFKMYRTFQVYRERKLRQLTEEERTTDRDGVFEFENGFSFTNENNEQVIFYGKLNALDKILEGYDELRISSLVKKFVRSSEIDYSRINKYMHQAIYLDDDVIYLDEMTIAKNTLQQESPPIVQLFCFIYSEIKKELEEQDSLPNKAYELAETFKINYLQPVSSLFDEDTFADTILILKGVFEDIDNKTPYKDEDFWHFYEAIEAFLFGERKDDNDGVYFGVNNFYDIWEDMCQNYVLSDPMYLSDILFADIKGRLMTRKDLGLSPDFKITPFKMEINKGFKPRYLKPDLVLLNTENANRNLDGNFEISKINKLQYENYKVVFSDYFRNKFPEIYNTYLKYLKLNTKYQQTFLPDDEWISHFHKDNFLQEVKDLLNKIELINLIDKNISLLRDFIITIIDYKYMRQSDYTNYNPNSFVINDAGENETKIKDDIQKQLIYEWAVQQNVKNSKTESEFWIPFFSEDLDFENSKRVIHTNPSFAESQIKVVKINFRILQDKYVKNLFA
jgi:hypothetical protein